MPTPVGTEEQERADGPVGVGETGAGPADRVGDRGDGFVLTDDARVQRVLHADELGHLALHQAADRDPRPLGDDLGDVLLVDLFLQHRLVGLQLVEPRGLRLDVGLELAHRPVAELRGAIEVALALGPLGLGARGLEPLLDLADLGDGVLLVLPAGDHRVAVLGQLRQLLLDRGEALPGDLVAGPALDLAVQRGLLDLELADAPLDDVDLERHRVDLDAQARRGLVDQVDRLVGELAAGDVAVGEHRRRDERGVLDAHTVVDLVALLEPAQDRDRVVDRRLSHVHLLEAPLERGVLLDVLAVLVERRRADHAQLAARQHRLDHVAGVDRALGAAGADDRVQLVDEGDDLTLGVGDLLQDGLQPVLELAAVLRARDHRADVERDEALVAQTFGNVALDDAAGEPLGDRGLTDAGLADEDRVVLRAPREHLDDAPDLLVAPDHRVELALARVLGEVAAVTLEGLVLLLGVLARDAVAAAHRLQRLEDGVVGDAEPAEQIADAAGDLGHREEDVLGGEVVVAQVRALRVGALEDAESVARHARLLRGLPVHVGLALQRLVDPVADGLGRDTQSLQHRQHDALGLAEKGGEEVLGRDLGVVLLAGQCLGGTDRLTGLAGELVRVERHQASLRVTGRQS